MSRYPLQELIELWKVERISQEQATGQILLWLQELQQQIYELERRGARGVERGAGGRRRGQGVKKQKPGFSRFI
jgi:hypothetical protein